MKLTLLDLDLLLRDPDFFHLPRRMAESKFTKSDSWERVLEVMCEEGLKSEIWKTLQIGALLFDTYGSTIHQISIRWTDDHQIAARVNHLMCLNDASNLTYTIEDHIQSVDESKAFMRFLQKVKQLNGSALMARQDIMMNFFQDHSFHDAQTMRQVAQDRAPEIHAWVKAQRLTMNVAQGRTDLGQTPKM